MRIRLLILFVLACLLGTLGSRLAAQSSPTLNINLFAPGLVEISWPSNYSTWQLATTTNMEASASWQVVPDPPIPFGNVLAAFSTLTNQSRFFRLQPAGSGGGGVCAFQATPSSISLGESSELSWCGVPDTTYQVLPTPGPVLGSNVLVTPAETTVYTLVASNLAGITFQSTTVTVFTAGCSFVSAQSWDCTVNLSYQFVASSSQYLFDIGQQYNLSIHLTPTSVTATHATFSGTVDGVVSVNDLENTLTLPPPDNIATVMGSGPPEPGSTVELDIDCQAGTYSFYTSPVIHADWTQNGTVNLLTMVGTLTLSNHSLPASYGSLTGSGSVPAHSGAWGGSGDAYLPGGLAPAMFSSGVVDETNGGTATVSWSFTPSP